LPFSSAYFDNGMGQIGSGEHAMSDVAILGAGVAVFLITAWLFWYCLPRGGKYHRFVGTELEPYVGVAFCSAIALLFDHDYPSFSALSALAIN
jgi:hypothetical protein